MWFPFVKILAPPLKSIETDIRIYEDKQGKIIKLSPKAIFAYALVFIYYSL